MIRRNKKRGIEAYISWVLLVAFTVSLGAFMYGWLTGEAQKSSKQIDDKTKQLLCQSVAVNVNGACQNPQTLYMNITNINLVGVDGFIIRVFDIYDNGQVSEINLTLSPADTKKLVMLKPGTVGQAELIPILYRDGSKLSCPNAMITLKRIEQC